MDWLHKFQTYEYDTVANCVDHTGKKPTGVRWVELNKGDDEHPDVRCRLVVQETKNVSTIPVEDVNATFAATPPLDLLRGTCSLCMSSETGELCGSEDEIVVQFYDISRAHPSCPINRNV